MLPTAFKKASRTFCSVNAGGVGGTGYGSSHLKNGDIFYVLGTMYANFQQFPIKWSIGTDYQTLNKSNTRITFLKISQSFVICPEAPFY